jgi:hypothetical protein
VPAGKTGTGEQLPPFRLDHGHSTVLPLSLADVRSGSLVSDHQDL